MKFFDVFSYCLEEKELKTRYDKIWCSLLLSLYWFYSFYWLFFFFLKIACIFMVQLTCPIVHLHEPYWLCWWVHLPERGWFSWEKAKRREVRKTWQARETRAEMGVDKCMKVCCEMFLRFLLLLLLSFRLCRLWWRDQTGSVPASSGETVACQLF